MHPINDKELRELFLTMSTNRDLRKVLTYYEEHGYDKNNLEGDFAQVLETLETEEIATRLGYDLFINFEGIKIDNNFMYDSLICARGCKKVQVDIISEKADLQMSSIQIILDNNTATPETLDRLIKNSTDKNLGNLEGEGLCLLNKESLSKLVKLSDNKPDLIYLLSLKKGLDTAEIDNILSVMKEKNIEMDNLYAENLLEQENLTNDQLQRIAFFENVPCPIVFSDCLKKNIYSENDIIDIYEKSNGDEQIINILLNQKTIPKKIVDDLMESNNEYAKSMLKYKKDIEER